jgi:hypothetical protein
MPNTTNYSIPYPANTDFVTNGAAAMGLLAGKVDDLLAGGQFMGGFRNKLINGDFAINQRGTAAVTTTGSFPSDRWKTFFNSGTYSAQTIAFGTTFNATVPHRFYTRHIVAGGSSAGNYSIFQQFIEGVDTLAGKVPTVSFWARTTAAPAKLGVSLDQNFGTGGSPSSGELGNGTSVTLSTSWQKFSVTLPALASVASKVVGTDGNDRLELFFWLSAVSSFDTRSGAVGVQSKTIEITGVQVEAGTAPTDYEYRPRQIEIGLCQRYYQKSYNLGTSPGTNTTTGVSQFRNDANNSGTFLRFTEFLRTQMRATPTFAVFTVAGTAGSISSFDGTARTHTVTTISNPSERGFAGFTIGTPTVPDTAEYTYHYTATAEL